MPKGVDIFQRLEWNYFGYLEIFWHIFQKKREAANRRIVLCRVFIILIWFLPWLSSWKFRVVKILSWMSPFFFFVFHVKDASSCLKERSWTDSTRSEGGSQFYTSHLPILTSSRFKSPCPALATSKPLLVIVGCVKSSVKTGHQLAIYTHGPNCKVHNDSHCWLPVLAINRGKEITRLCQLMDSDFPAFGVSEWEKSFPTGQAEPRKQWNNTDQKRKKIFE